MTLSLMNGGLVNTFPKERFRTMLFTNKNSLHCKALGPIIDSRKDAILSDKLEAKIGKSYCRRISSAPSSAVISLCNRKGQGPPRNTRLIRRNGHVLPSCVLSKSAPGHILRLLTALAKSADCKLTMC